MRRVLFDRTMAEHVRDFDCGDTPHAREVSDFISGKTGQVWYLVEQMGGVVWLYLADDDEIILADDDEIIGFGSLAVQVVVLEEVLRPIGSMLMIPYFGVRTKFHRKPGDDYRQFYARQIFRDLVAEARVHPSGLRRLGLYVNPANVGAMRLYSDPEFGFRKQGTFDGDDCMVADL